jgi:hypothetical protein
VAATTAPVRDDRLLPITRGLSYVFVPVLGIAFLLLYVTPTRTDDFWAWTIRPDMTPTVMGAGYLAGATIFAAGLYFGQWHRITWAMVGTEIFSVMMLLATLIHWERFNHDHPAFWVWFLLYVGTPIIAPVVWVMNRQTDPGLRPGEQVIPQGIRYAFAFAGAIDLVVAVVVFIDPDIAIDAWPWVLTPLTARVLSSFVAFVGVVWLCMLLDARWTAFSVTTGATVFGLALIAVGALTRTDEFSGSSESWLFVVSLVAAIAATGGLLLYMRSARGEVGGPAVAS